MGQPRLITAQFNRIQCGRRGWLQGPAFFFFFPVSYQHREGCKEGVCVFVCVCVEKSASMGEKSIKR